MARKPVAPPEPDDIVLEDKKLSQQFEQEAAAAADDLHFRGRDFQRARVSSVRRAVCEDAGLVRDKVTDGIGRTREVIRDEPMRVTLYALGVGLVLGLLLRR